MNKKIIIALLLIALSVIVMVMNTGGLSVNLLGWKIGTRLAFGILGFEAVGVAIGLLLK